MAKRKSTAPKVKKNSSEVAPQTESGKKIMISSTPDSSNKGGASGAYSNSAIAMMPPGQSVPTSKLEQILGIKIARAMQSGPRHITKDATVAEMGADGKLTILRHGTNHWICFPGDENQIGNPPVCADPMGLQWMMDIMAKKPQPTNTALICTSAAHLGKGTCTIWITQVIRCRSGPWCMALDLSLNVDSIRGRMWHTCAHPYSSFGI